MKRRKLLLVAPNLGDGGTQRVVTVLAGALHERGRAVTVVTLYRGEDHYALPPGVERISLVPGSRSRLFAWLGNALSRLAAPLPSLFGGRAFLAIRALERRLAVAVDALVGRLVAAAVRVLPRGLAWRLHLPTWLRVRGLRRLIRDQQPDGVVAFCGSTNLITVLAGADARLVISERNDPALQRLDEPWQSLRPKLYRRADLVTANTRGALRAMERYVDGARLRYAPNPLWEGPVEAPLALDPGRRLLIVGRLHRQKAHDVLLDAFARAAPSLEGWRLSVVGTGEEEEPLRALAARLGIAERVDWHGQVENPYAFYRAADVFVLPSRHEGFPNALLEAMSAAVAVIVSDASSGPLEIVRHDENGVVVPVEDAEALAAAIVELAGDPDRRRRLGAAAARAVEAHRLPNVIGAWETLIDEGSG